MSTSDSSASAFPMHEGQAQTLLRIARELLARRELEDVLPHIIEAARELTSARYAAIGVLDDERRELARFVTSGIDDESRREIGDLPRGRGVLGELIRDPRPLRLEDVSTHPRSYGFPAGHPSMTTFLGVPVRISGEPYGNLYLTDKVGGPFDEEDEEAVVALADLAGIALDNARRYAGSRGRAADLEQTVATLEATTEIARALGGTTDLDVVLELVSKRGRALVSARTLVVALPLHGQLSVAACAGEAPTTLKGSTYDPARLVEEVALRTGAAQRWGGGEPSSARSGRALFGREDITADAGLAVPLRFANRGIGVLIALDRQADGPGFSAEDERLLSAFAFTAATAIATAQRVARERHRQRLAAAEAERARWARELHDETLQNLAALRISLGAARRRGGETLVGAVDDAIDDLGREVDNLRTLIAELRPAALDQLGIVAAIRALAERLSGDGLAIQVEADVAWEGDGGGHAGPELESAVYRLTQEALSNVVKHAGATHASVALRERGDRLEVSVRDDGCGFDVGAATEGFGLIGMTERVELLEGNVTIESDPGTGTTIVVTLPLLREDRAEGTGSDQPVRLVEGRR